MEKQILNKSQTIFQKQVLAIVKKIPKGQVMTYKQVAERVGRPKAARAVGSVVAKNQDLSIPCHRVVRSDGTLGPYNGLQGKTKEVLLREEGAL